MNLHNNNFEILKDSDLNVIFKTPNSGNISILSESVKKINESEVCKIKLYKMGNDKTDVLYKLLFSNALEKKKLEDFLGKPLD